MVVKKTLLGSSRRVSFALLKLGILTPVVCGALVTCFTPISTHAVTGINEKINFQGRLLNAAGATVPDGFYNIQFKIYQDGDGLSVGNTTGSPAGTLKWTEDHLNSGGLGGGGTTGQGVMIKNGFLSVDLGSITAFGSNVDWNQDTLWLSMNVGDTNITCTPFSSCTPDGEMVPMKRLTSTPYSLNSGRLGGLTSSNFVQLAQGTQTEAGNSTNSIALNKTGTGGNFLKLQASGVDALTVTNAGDITFGANADHTISVATAGAGVAGKAITISAGAAGTDASPLTGGTLTLQGGAGGGTNGNGGNVSIEGGAANGTGTGGSVLVGTTSATEAVSIGRTGKTTTINGALTATEATNLNGGLTVSNGGNVAFEKGSDYSATGPQNDVSFGTGVMFRLTGASAVTITGIAGGVNGRILTLVNDSVAPAIIANSNGGSSANNQITTGTGADITLQIGASITLAYDSGANKWRVTAGTGAAPNTYIENQNSTDQSANFRISGTGQANTSILTPKLDTATGVQLDIGNTTATAIAIGRSAITTTVTGGFTQQTGAFSLTGNADSQISTSGATALSINGGTNGLNIGTANVANTIQIGNVANAIAQDIRIGNNATVGSTTNVTIGNLLGTSSTVINGGTGTSAIAIEQGSGGTVKIATANAGILSIGKLGSTATFNGNLTVGAAAGDGTTLTVNGATVNSTLVLGNFASGGSIGANTATVDVYTAASVAQTTADQTLTVPTPTANTTYGRTFYITNVGTAGFTLLNRFINPGSSVTLIWSNTNGAASWTFASTERAGGLILVAASNSSATDKAAADYIATGTNDHTTINNALTAADPAGSGRKSGKVQLFAGTYTIGGSISIPNNTTLVGSGRGSRITIPNSFASSINAITNTDTSTGTGVTIQDLQLDGNAAAQTGARNMTGIFFNGMGGGAGSSARAGGKVSNVWAHDWYDNTSTNGGIVLSNSRNNTISNNTVVANTDTGIYLASNSHYNTITGNVSQGNAMGISLSSSDNNTIASNQAQGNTSRGIDLSGSNNNTITGNNIFDNGGASNNNGIYLATSDSNTITGNTVTDSAATTNYSVNVSDSGSDTNYLADNTLGTGTVNDSGTGTRYGGQATGTTFALQPGSDISMQAPASGTINIGTANVATKAINIGSVVSTAQDTTVSIADSSAGTQIVSIGNTASATSTTTIRGGTGSSAIMLTQGSGGTITIGATGGSSAVSVQCGTGTCGFGNNATDHSTTVGSTTGTSLLTLNGGTGGINIGTANVAQTIQIGNTANAVTQTINIGNNSNGGTTNVVVGSSSSAAAGQTTIQSKDNTVIKTNNVDRATFDTSGNLFVGNGVSSGSPASFVISGTRSATTAVTGGALSLTGGNATTGNANGGNITVSGGSGSGTGVSGLVVLTTPTFQTASSGTSQTCGSNCNVTQANVDSNGVVVINASVASLTVTLPSPTQGASPSSYGRIVYVTAAYGSNDFTLSVNGGGVGNLVAMRANTTATMVWGPGNAGAGAWTAAGASSSTTLQAAYDNTLQSSGGAELVVSKTSATNGLTIRDSSTSPVNGALVSIQSSSAAGLLSVSSNLTEYASNAGAETAGSGGSSTFPSSTWSAAGGANVTRNTTAANIATGQGSVSVVATSANDGVKNTLVSALNVGLTYNVSFSALLSSGSFSNLTVDYSKDGSGTTSCTSNQQVMTKTWARISCSFTVPSGANSSNQIWIRQATGVSRTFFIDNLSVTSSAGQTYVTDGGVDSALGTNWVAVGGSATQSTSNGYEKSSSAQITTTASATSGIKNQLSVAPLASTASTTYLYRATAYVQTQTTALTAFKIRYSRDNGTNFVDCVDYNQQTVSTSSTAWQKITCIIQTDTTAASSPYVFFEQGDTTIRSGTLYIDSFSLTIANSTTPNVQIGGGTSGGPTTLFTLDRGASAPIADDNQSLLGSMYYDTTLGKLQCYEADGWGACGSSPDNIITISPEYTNAVMHGTGVGTLTSDFCSDDLNINDGTSSQPTICVNTSGQAFNFYKWTSPQASAQTYSVYVTYQLPGTFKAFLSGQTNIIGKTDSTNSTVRYKVFKKTNSALTQCGSNWVSVSTGVQTNWQTGTASGTADPSTCSFAATNSIVFQIEVTSSSNANAYLSNLNFAFNNN